jgi:hypothetical protein
MKRVAAESASRSEIPRDRGASDAGSAQRSREPGPSRDEVVYETGPPTGPPTHFGDPDDGNGRLPRALPATSLERTTGFEPATPTWQGDSGTHERRAIARKSCSGVTPVSAGIAPWVFFVRHVCGTSAARSPESLGPNYGPVSRPGMAAGTRRALRTAQSPGSGEGPGLTEEDPDSHPGRPFR